jgi:hypothetical protein
VSNNDLDKFITDINRKRPEESKGHTVGVQLTTGEKIVGNLVKHYTNRLIVHDWRDEIDKEIHRATVARFLILVDSKNGDTDGRTEKKD